MEIDKTFYIFVHEIGGSKYEATCPQYYFGPYTKEEADKAMKTIESKLGEIKDDYHILQLFDTSSSHIENSIDNFLTYLEENQ